MARLKLSPPWDIYYRMVSVLFKKDPDVRVIYDDDQRLIKLYVEAPEKAEALNRILPDHLDYGSVTLEISVIPANGLTDPLGGAFEAAFEGNPIVSYVHKVDGVFVNPLTYIVFKPEIVQMFTDDLGDIGGISSFLYEGVAEEVFPDHDGVFFCTDIIQDGEPLGNCAEEWP